MQTIKDQIYGNTINIQAFCNQQNATLYLFISKIRIAHDIDCLGIKKTS